MKVFLLENVSRVGMKGEIITTSEGYARNYLIPRKKALEVTPGNEASFSNRIKVIESKKKIIDTKTSELAEKIKSIELVLQRKMHNNKLYGAIGAHEIVDLLSQKNITIAKNQVNFDMSIKTTGVYPVTIKLSSTLQPKLIVKVIPEGQ